MKRLILSFAVLLASIAILYDGVLARQSLTAGSSSDPAFVPGEIIVKLRTRGEQGRSVSSQKEAALFAAKHDLSETSRIDSLNVRVYELRGGGDLLEAASRLSADPSVEYAEPNYYRYPDALPNDTDYSNVTDNGVTYANSFQRWVFNGAGSDRNLNGELAWDLSTGRPDVVIAIIDSGVQLDNPDLVGNMWRNERDPLNGNDDDGNGYIDDVNGWDFRGNTFSGASIPDNDPNPDLGDGIDNDQNDGADSTTSHGTFVASVAAARGNNELGIAGACWNCRIMPLKVFTDDGGAKVGDVAEAIMYAANNGAAVINLSLSSANTSLAESDAIAHAISKGVTVVASGGNGNSNSERRYPARYANVISVGATDWGGDLPAKGPDYESSLRKRAPFTQFSSRTIDVVAPGVVAGLRINTRADETSGKGAMGSSTTRVQSGTSFSSPLVAATAALIISYARDLNRPITNSEVRQIIFDTAVKLGDDPGDTPNGLDTWDNYGRVDMLETLRATNGSSNNVERLTSRVPISRTIPAPDSQPLLGLTQYVITVPANLPELRIELSGSPNLNLYAEKQRRVKVSDGNVYASHISQGPGGTKSLSITAGGTPKLEPGDYFIAVENAGPGEASFELRATIKGLAPAIEVIGMFDHSQVLVGQTSEWTLSVRNKGREPLVVTSTSIENGNFSLTTPALPYTIGSGELKLPVQFKPTLPGHQSAELVIASNDPDMPALTVQLKGEGVTTCTYVVTNTFPWFFAHGGASRVDVTALKGCTWTASKDAEWATFLSNAQGNGTGTFAFSVAPNTGPYVRHGEIAIGDKKVKFNQNGAIVPVSAASFGKDVAIGSIAAVFGSFVTLNNQSYAASTIPLPTTLGGVSVSLGGRSAGLLFVGPGQINFLVPGNSGTSVMILNVDGTRHDGQFSYAPIAPGIFTVSSDGKGTAAALTTFDGLSYESTSNPDGSEREVPSGTDSKPNVLVLFGTGWRAAGSSGITATIGSVPALVTYAGAAPGYEGLDQANVIIPRGVSGSVEVVLTGGGKSSNVVRIRIAGSGH